MHKRVSRSEMSVCTSVGLTVRLAAWWRLLLVAPPAPEEALLWNLRTLRALLQPARADRYPELALQSGNFC